MHIVLLTSETTDKFSFFRNTTLVLLIHLKSHLISCPAKLLEWVGVNVTEASSETRHGGLVQGCCQHWYGKSTWNILILAIAPRPGGFWLHWNNQQQRANTLPWKAAVARHWPHLIWLYMTSLVKGSPAKFGWAAWGWLKESLTQRLRAWKWTSNHYGDFPTRLPQNSPSIHETCWDSGILLSFLWKP